MPGRMGEPAAQRRARPCSAWSSRNPALAGGATAFLVALSFVSANALWYQPYAHSGAFFATRDFSRAGPLRSRPPRR